MADAQTQLPQQFLGLPDEAQQIARAVLDACGDVGVSVAWHNRAAMAAVRTVYTQHYETGEWTKRDERELALYAADAGAMARAVALSVPGANAERLTVALSGLPRFVASAQAAGRAHDEKRAAHERAERAIAERLNAEPLRLASAAEIDATKKTVTYAGREYVVGKPIQITREGVFAGKNKKTLDFRKANIEKVIANALSQKRVASLDFNHSATDAEGQEAIAAGVVLPETLYHEPGVGLFGVPYYTTTAAESVARGEWNATSPTIVMNAEDFENPGTYIGPVLYAVALCNVPHQPGMEPVELAADTTPAIDDGGSEMTKILERLNAKTEDEAGVELDKLTAKVAGADKALSDVALALGCEPTIEKLVATAQAKGAEAASLKGEVTKLAASVKSLEDDRAKTRAENAVEKAVRSGKLAPAEREAWLKLAASDSGMFESLLAVKPQSVPIGAAIGHGLAPEGEPGTVTEEEASETLRLACLKVAETQKLTYAQVMDRLGDFEETRAANKVYLDATVHARR